MSINRGMENVVHIYNGTLFSHKKEWNIVIAETWMDLEITRLSEVSQTEKDKYHMISHIRYVKKKKKMIQMDLFTKQKQTHRHRKQT